MKISDIREIARRAESFESPLSELRPQRYRIYRPFLHLLVAKWKPDVFVELGTDRGITTTWVALASSDTKVVTVDISEKPRGCDAAKKLIKYPNVVRIIGDSISPDTLEKARTAFAPSSSIDILFIDSSHKYKHVSAEHRLWSKMMNPQHSLIAADDCGGEFRNWGVKKWWSEVVGRKMQLDFLHMDFGGFGVIFIGEWDD